MNNPLHEIADALRAYTEPQPMSFSERRAHVRLKPFDLPRPVLARLKHGPVLTLIDVSEGGALVETAARLTPGAHMVLEFLAPGARRAARQIPSRVLRAHVTSLEAGELRYRGGLAFKQLLQLTELAAEEPELDGPAADTTALVDAIASIRTVAYGSRDKRAARLLDEIVREAQVSPSPRALMTFVEERLRRQVPLATVGFATRRPTRSQNADCLAFELGQAEGDDPLRLHVEFRPSRRLDDGQMRLLHAAASVMSLIYSWNRTLFEPGSRVEPDSPVREFEGS